MCPLVVKEFFILSKQNVLFTTAANIAECAVNNDEIKENTKTSMPSYVQNLQVHCKIAFSNHK